MAAKFSQSHYTTLIVGAGLQGLACARTFLRIDPTSDLLILDAQQTIGGVWAKERLYPGLRTNNQIGTFEFSDFPVLEAGLDDRYGLKPESHLSGEAVHDYLVKFAEKENLMPHVRLDCKIIEAKETDTRSNKTGWAVEVLASGETVTLTCDVLIFAIGTCNNPRPIEFPGRSSFAQPFISFAELGTTGVELAQDANVHHVTIYGGGKSAYDCVYHFATAGKRVTWVVRKSGKGARYMAPPFINLGPFRKWLEGLLVTRPLTWLSPCVFGDEDGYGSVRQLLHGSWLGTQIVKTFFTKMTSDTVAQSGLDPNDPRMRPLVPRELLFWHATQCGILNYPTDFWDLIRSNKVEVVERDISELGPDGAIHFDDGSQIHTDALIAAAGWDARPSVKLLPEEKHAEWGIPSASYSAEQSASWAARHKRANEELLARFPLLAESCALKTQPLKEGLGPSEKLAEQKESQSLPPYRLYRAIAPPNQAASSKQGTRNLVFLGAITNFQNYLRAEVTSLWTWAYLNHALDRDPGAFGSERVMQDTALLGQWAAIRYPLGNGKTMPDLMFDGLAYMDMLTNDLGLAPRRGLLSDLFGGMYQCSEWAGLIDEWKASKSNQ